MKRKQPKLPRIQRPLKRVQLNVLVNCVVYLVLASNAPNAVANGEQGKEEWEAEIAAMKPIHEQISDGKFPKGFLRLCLKEN